MKKALYIVLIVLVAGLIGSGITYASFKDKVDVTDSTMTVGSADFKLLVNLTGGITDSNLTEELPGPTLSNITPNWSQEYLVKLYNYSSSTLGISSHSSYVTDQDPDDLRTYVQVEIIDWYDENNNGTVEQNEVGESYGKKTITKWKTEGFNLGQVNVSSLKGLILRFSSETIPDTKQGKAGIFNFQFDSIEL